MVDATLQLVVPFCINTVDEEVFESSKYSSLWSSRNKDRLLAKIGKKCDESSCVTVIATQVMAHVT